MVLRPKDGFIFYQATSNLVFTDIHITPSSSTSTPATSTNYTVTYTITNTGAGYAAASSTTITINGIAITPIACPALAPGAFDTKTTPTQTVAGSHDHIVVTNGSATASIGYYYQPLGSQQGNNDVSGTINGVFQFTAPGAVAAWNPTGSSVLTPGTTPLNNYNNAVPMVVNSNGSWIVTASGENGGYLSKWNGSSYASPSVHLANQLYVASSSVEGSVAYSMFMSNSAQTLATGDTSGLDGSTGYSRTIPVSYRQAVLFSDPALATGFVYHMTIIYVCSPTAY